MNCFLNLENLSTLIGLGMGEMSRLLLIMHDWTMHITVEQKLRGCCYNCS